MSSPYYDGNTAPVVAAANAAGLRAVSSNLFEDANTARILGAGTFEWDSSSTAADDGTSVIKPDDILPANPGRWIVIPAGGTSGSGTDNHLVRWDGTSDVQDSAVTSFDTGTFVFAKGAAQYIYPETEDDGVAGRRMALEAGSAGASISTPLVGGDAQLLAGFGSNSIGALDGGPGGDVEIYGGIGGDGLGTGDGGAGGTTYVYGGFAGWAFGGGSKGPGGSVLIIGGPGLTGGDASLRGGAGDTTHGAVKVGDADTSRIDIGNATDNPIVKFFGTGSIDLDGSVATSRWIQFVDTPADSNGPWLNIKAGNATTSPASSRSGGTFNLIGGDGGDCAGWDGGDGGAVVLYGGAAGDTTHATRPGGVGGGISIGGGQGGDAAGSGAGGAGGAVGISGGNGRNPTGTGNRGNGGAVSLSGGPGLTGGAASVYGGYGNDTGNGGAANLYGGRALGSGSHGAVNIGASYTSAINIGAAGTPTTFKGSVSIDATTVAETFLDLDDGTGAAVSAAGHIRFRSNAGVAELSQNGSGWGALGNVSAAAVIADNRLVRGDGGVRGVQGSGISLDDSDRLSGVTSLAFGSSPATAGEIRLELDDTIRFGDGVGVNRQALQINAAGNLLVGDYVNVGDLYLDCNDDITIRTAGASVLATFRNEDINFSRELIISTGYWLQFGTSSIATDGQIRFSTSGNIQGRTSGATNAPLLSWAADTLAIGASNAPVVVGASGGSAAFFGSTPTTKPTALTTKLTQITHTGPTTPDYAIATPVDSGVGSAWGFSSQDEFETAMSVILNLQKRVDELESKFQALGLLT